MTAPVAQQSKAFSIERKEGKAPGTVIFCFHGPFTAREMYGHLTPQALDNMLRFQSTPDEKQPERNILDLTEVPYMDSAGLGMIMTHYVHCKNRGVAMFAAGATPRVMQLFEMTKVNTVLPLAATVDEVDIS